MTSQLDVATGRDIVARWCALAERRLEHLTELYETGRWRRFYSENEFLENVRETKSVVEAWRDLLSCEASRDNKPIDFSWLNRRATAVPNGEIWCDPVHLVRAEAIARDAGTRDPIVVSDNAVDANHAVRDGEQGEPAAGFSTITQRYPLLHNAL